MSEEALRRRVRELEQALRDGDEEVRARLGLAVTAGWIAGAVVGFAVSVAVVVVWRRR